MKKNMRFKDSLRGARVCKNTLCLVQGLLKTGPNSASNLRIRCKTWDGFQDEYGAPELGLVMNKFPTCSEQFTHKQCYKTAANGKR